MMYDDASMRRDGVRRQGVRGLISESTLYHRQIVDIDKL